MTPAELKQARLTLKMNRLQLAAALGVSPGAISLWESGKRSLPPFLHLALDQLKRSSMPAKKGHNQKGSTQHEEHSRKKDRLKDFLKGDQQETNQSASKGQRKRTSTPSRRS